jgi:hypothetical protein
VNNLSKLDDKISMFVGMDLHKNYLQIAVMNDKGKVLENSRINNNLPQHQFVTIGELDRGHISANGGAGGSRNILNSGSSVIGNGGNGGIAVRGTANGGNGATCSSHQTTGNCGNGGNGGIAANGGVANGQAGTTTSNGANGGIAVGKGSNANNGGLAVNGGITGAGCVVVNGHLCVIVSEGTFESYWVKMDAGGFVHPAFHLLGHLKCLELPGSHTENHNLSNEFIIVRIYRQILLYS